MQKMNAYIGIDPGLHGGVVVVDGNENIIHKEIMPIIDGGIDAFHVARILNHFKNKYNLLVVLEKVGAMPGQGVCAMFTFGEGVGVLKACIQICKVPYIEVRPQQWKKEVLVGLPWKAESTKFVPPKDISKTELVALQKAHKSKKSKAKKEAKAVSATFVRRRFPQLDMKMGKKNDHDGIADAVCLALYGKQVKQGNKS